MRKYLVPTIMLSIAFINSSVYSYDFVSVNFPSSVETRIFGNDKNSLVGWYKDTNEKFHGFLYDGINWTSLEYPGSPLTKARGLDGNKVVGFHVHDGMAKGFLYDGDNWERLEYPSSLSTIAFGVNGDDVVGDYKDINNIIHGFHYKNGNWETLDYPGATETHLRNIDENGNMVGWYSYVDEANGRVFVRGFYFNGHEWSSLLYPGSTNTSAFDIINGNIVGSWSSQGTSHGFIYDGEHWTTIDVPNSIGTRVRGLDIRGNISGWYWDDTGNHGFTARILPSYQYIPIDFPGDNIHTYVTSIDEYRVVGLYRNENDDNRKHGFSYDGRGWETIDFPDSTFTEILGVDETELVGSYQLTGETIFHGFQYNSDGWQELNYPTGVPGEVVTRVRGIDDGSMVGFYYDLTNPGALRGFLYEEGNWTTLLHPNAINTTAFDIDKDNIVGTYKDTQQLVHGFLYSMGTWSNVDYVGDEITVSSSATGISGGRVVGWYRDSDMNEHGYLSDFGNIFTINYPGAIKTYLRGVDMDGNLVGWFRDANNQDHGFIAIQEPHNNELPTYGSPKMNPFLDKNLFVWNNRGTGIWHIIATAGGDEMHYEGVITTSEPVTNLTEYKLEVSDTVSISTPNQIDFSLNVVNKFKDGFSFSVPVGSTVQIELNDNSVGDQNLIRVGGYRWKANELPIVLTD